MKELFVDYELACELEKLGFSSKYFLTLAFVGKLNEFYSPHEYVPNSAIWTPLYQEAFDWFREKYKLTSHIDIYQRSHLSDIYYYQVINFADFINESTTIRIIEFTSYQEARQACLEKLIEIAQKTVEKIQ